MKAVNLGNASVSSVDGRLAWLERAIKDVERASHEDEPESAAGDIGSEASGMVTAETVQEAIDQIAYYLGYLFEARVSRQAVLTMIAEQLGGSLTNITTLQADVLAMKHALYGGI